MKKQKSIYEFNPLLLMVKMCLQRMVCEQFRCNYFHILKILGTCVLFNGWPCSFCLFHSFIGR